MKKPIKWAGLLIIVLLIIGFIRPQGHKAKSENSVKKIQNKKALTVGTSADYAPFEFPIVKQGHKKFVGYDMMIAKKIADNLGVKLRIVNTEFPSLITELQDSKVDLVLAGLVSTPTRKKAVAFSKPYYHVKNQLLVNKENAHKYQKISDLNGKTVGAQQSTTQETIVKSQLKKSHPVIESNLTSLTTELGQKKLSGLVVENEIAHNFVTTYPHKYAIAPIKLTTPKNFRYINIAVRKSDKSLLKRVNGEITRLQKKGRLPKMLKQAQSIQAKYN